MDKYRVTKGIKNGVILKGNQREILATEKFSNYFGVTFSRSSEFKYNRYTLVFLQPDDKMQTNFNLSNEFLLIFSSYPSFDQRTFDFVDKTIQEDFHNRLDKLCIFVVSEDPKIVKLIDDLLDKQKDYRLIVPFYTEEIISIEFSEKQLLERMRGYLYSRDLFSFESPLQNDEYFYGRSKIVQNFYSKYSFGQQSGLFGLRKIGKTSVLYALQRTIEHRNGKSIYLDCSSPSIYFNRWYVLLKMIIEKIYLKYNLILNSDIDDFTEKNATEKFEKFLIEAYEELDDKRILIIFDEIENITYSLSPNENWKTNFDSLYFWGAIRSVFQRNPTIFSFIITGVNPRIVEMSHIGTIDNPIFAMIEKVYLEFFSYSDVKQMVSSIGGYMGLNFDDEIFVNLLEDYGGHPFLIRQVCSFINKNTKTKPFRVDRFLYKQYKPDFDLQLYSYIEQIVGVLKNYYPHEYELLSILANEGHIAFLEEIVNKDEVAHLIGYGILNERNNKYTITINAIIEYLKVGYSKKKTPKKIEEKWAIVSSRRNNLEIRLRSIISNVLVSNKGKSNAKNIILGVKETSLRDKIRNDSIEKILENAFYFPDYITLIDKNWELFEKHFIDKTKFGVYMDVISNFRIDAHAKNISDENYALLKYALDWFDKCLE